MAKIQPFQSGELTKERLNEAVALLNAIAGLKITVEGANDGQPYARLLKPTTANGPGDWTLVLIPERLGGTELRTYRVCGLDGPELVQIRVTPVPEEEE